MTEVGITTLILILANIFCSLQGLNDHLIFDRYNFEIDKIILHKDYKRLVISAFFHVSWVHLILNMVSLCVFSGGLEMQLGWAKYLFIYFTGLLCGNLFSLFVHRHHGDYRSAGATGAVGAVIFATIALFPGYQIGFFGIHLPIPGWFYGFLYVLFSMYGVKSKGDNIGHDGHLAGAVAGLIVAVLMQPVSITHNYLAILAIIIPSLFFIYIIVTRPRFLLVNNNFYILQKNDNNIETIHLIEQIDHQQEIDLILEKIHQNGIASLSKAEKEKLEYYSKIIR